MKKKDSMTYEEKAEFVRTWQAKQSRLRWGDIAAKLGVSQSLVSQAVRPQKLELVCDKIIKQIEKEDRRRASR